MFSAIKFNSCWGVAKRLRHRTLNPACVGSNPTVPIFSHSTEDNTMAVNQEKYRAAKRELRDNLNTVVDEIKKKYGIVQKSDGIEWSNKHINELIDEVMFSFPEEV
jgi:hypothetical protein